MLSFPYRFHGHNSLKYVYKNGNVVRTKLFTLKYIENQRREIPRVSIVVSKKVHKSAVGRNRIRRRLYEVIRHHLPYIDGSYDIVCVVISADVIDIEAGELTSQVTEALVKAGLYKNT